MSDYRDYFKDKKITVMRIGLLGRGVGDTAYLAECGADILVVDDAPQEVMQPSVDALKEHKNVRFKFGPYEEKDFTEADIVLKGAGAALDQPQLVAAEKAGVAIEMSASLVAKLTKTTVIGVTGTRGKSTVTHLIHHILKEQGRKVHLAGNVRGVATLPILNDIEDGDLLVMELDSWQMQGFGSSKMSPQISVFTTFFADHLNYYGDMQKYFDDKANIFKYQKSEDALIMSPQAREAIDKYYKGPINSEKIVVDPLPINNRFLMGVHNKYNAACAMEVAKNLGMEEEDILSAIKSFPGVEGRLQFVRNLNGISIYNDNNATTADATVAGLKALSRDKNVVLIVGGSDKGLDMSELIKEIPKHCRGVVLFDGKGTDTIRDEVKALEGLYIREESDLEKTVKAAIEIADEGDVILYSPAFASFGAFKNEYDRNDQFLGIVENL